MHRFLVAVFGLFFITFVYGREPDIKGGSYAETEACKFDLWKAQRSNPAPLIIFIHGGGFAAGNLDLLPKPFRDAALEAGFAVMTISYPLLREAPVQKILPTMARAVQYARSQAVAWNIDPDRIGCLGGSAGGGASLWIAVHPDLAVPKSDDPVARESSRIQAAASVDGQATYDLLKWKDITGPPYPEIRNEAHGGELYDFAAFYGVSSASELESPAGLSARRAVDMPAFLDSSDPPMLVINQRGPNPPPDRSTYLHHPLHAKFFYEKAREAGVTGMEINLDARGWSNCWAAALPFFIKTLKPAPAK